MRSIAQGRGLRGLATAGGVLYWVDPDTKRGGLFAWRGVGEPARIGPVPENAHYAVAARVAYDVHGGWLRALRDGVFAPVAELGPSSRVQLRGTDRSVLAVSEEITAEDRVLHRVVRFEPETLRQRVIHRATLERGAAMHVAVDDERVFVVAEEVFSQEAVTPPPGAYDATLWSTRWRLSILDHTGAPLAGSHFEKPVRRTSRLVPDGRGKLVLAADDEVHVLDEHGATCVARAPGADAATPTSSGVAWRTHHGVSMRADGETRSVLETEHAVREIVALGDEVAALIDPETNPVLAVLGTSEAIREIVLLP